MSIEALNWAFNLAPVPMDHGKRGSKPNPACASVLIGLANHAGPDGRNAFPGVPTLMRYTRLSERTVRTAIDRLAEDKIILPGDPAIVAAFIKRGDRRPEVWDLDMTLIRDDLTPEDIAYLERQFPGLTQRIANGVHSSHPVTQNGVQPSHPANSNGVQPSPNGVQLPQERGATAAPKPSVEPPVEPPHTPMGCVDAHAHTREAPPDFDASEAEIDTNTTGRSSKKSGKSGSKTRKRSESPRATRIPDDFALTDGMRAEAAERWPGLDVETETREFINYWRYEAPKSKAKKVDWRLTWEKNMAKKWGQLPRWQRVHRDPMLVEAARDTVDKQWEWATRQGPVVGRTRDDLEALVVDALAAGATIEQVQAALGACVRVYRQPVPYRDAFQRALWGQPVNGSGKPRPDINETFQRAQERAQMLDEHEEQTGEVVDLFQAMMRAAAEDDSDPRGLPAAASHAIGGELV